jgi:NAD(P)-dependent dehydrogenase (short-subunit alcohol dehydrogenase family)
MKPVCLITGARGRLGQDLCVALANEYNVVATYHSQAPKLASEHNTHFENEQPSSPNSIFLIQADLTKREDIQRLMKVVMARYGQVDALINSAADIKFHGHLRDLWQADNYAQSQLHLNSIVPIQLASAIFQYCWKDNLHENLKMNRSVVNVSSISGLYVFQEANQSFYGVSKSALNMLTQYLSLEFAPYGVRVNAICPSRFVEPLETRRVTESIIKLLENDSTGEIVSNRRQD